jgi:xeroderma pigmentosum group C-complementing protein
MWTVIQPSSNFAAPGSAKPGRLSQLIPKHPHPSKVMTYVLAFDQSVSEITPRYVPNFLSVATLARSRLLSNQFLSEIFEDEEPTTTWQFKERQQMEQYQVMEKMPQSLAGFRNHPLYTLPQLLHKNQFILPSTRPIGLFKGSPVYDTNSVLNLKSEMNWYLLGRVVKEGESALKFNLFAEYQTKLYEPPIIEDGKLPRNKHGNWDLYQPHMLPQNTVHINLPNVLTFLKTSDYEYVEAVTGFIFNKQGAIPQVNGAIVHSVDAEEIKEYCEAELERKEKEERFKEKKEAYLLWIDIIKFVKSRARIMKEFGVE